MHGVLPLPKTMDPLRWAEGQRRVMGYLPVADLPRLAALLYHAQGDIAVDLQFEVNEQGWPLIVGQLRVTLSLTCQRCLEEWSIPLEVRVALALMSPSQMAEEERLPPGFEPLEVQSTPMPLADLIEDEVILALPLVPNHPLAECPAGKYVAQPQKEAPVAHAFAALATLKKN